MTNHETQLHFAIALTLLRNVGAITARKLLAHFGSPEAIFKASPKSLLQISGIGSLIVQELRKKEYLIEADKILACCAQANYQILVINDPNYPIRLQQIYDAPLLLYFKGNLSPNTERAVGVVGTRRATEYGKKFCYQFGNELHKKNISIVSGLAFGIDAAIHQSCIDFNIPNFAVLAGGFHHIYPYQHRKMAENIQANGGLLTEYPPFTKPDPRHFPMRNRIIAGLIDALIVVEAAESGGALITAEYANNYHREVFAVPGPIDKPFSMGCNQLIVDHKAHLLPSIQHFLHQLNWEKGEIGKQKKLEFDYSIFSQNESAVLAALHLMGDLSIEELSWKTAIPLKEIALITINLEFKGVIKAMAGNRYDLV